jgi:hypothetical protein
MPMEKQMISSAEFLERLRMGEYAKDICTSTNTPMHRGVTSAAAIATDAVIKWHIDTFYSHQADADSTMRFIESVATEDRKYFPTTEKIHIGTGSVLLQERIIPACGTFGMWTQRPADYIRQLIMVSFKYGIGDVHHENFGHRPTDFDTPVIFDIGYLTDNIKNSYRRAINNNFSHAEAMQDACDCACIPTASFDAIVDVHDRYAFFNTIPCPWDDIVA